MNYFDGKSTVCELTFRYLIYCDIITLNIDTNNSNDPTRNK